MQDEINRAAADTNPYDQVSLAELNREMEAENGKAKYGNVQAALAEVDRAAAATNPYDQVSLAELNREADERLAREAAGRH